MKDLIPFDFQDSVIRAVLVDGEPHLVAKDVAAALGYADPTNAVKLHCRGVAKYHPIVDSLGRTQEARVIGEADVMRLIVSSKLPAAEAFERKVFEDILPTIRKTGGYGQVQQLSGPALYLAAIEQAQGEIQALEARARVLEPKAAAFDDFLSSEGDYSINAASKLLQRRGFKTGQNRLANLLLDWGWLYRGEKKNLRASQAQLNCERLAENTFYYIDRVSGEKKSGRTQVRITPKGVDAIASRMEVDQTLIESEATA